MLKKVCVTAVSFALYAASCLGQANSNDGLSQLWAHPTNPVE